MPVTRIINKLAERVGDWIRREARREWRTEEEGWPPRRGGGGGATVGLRGRGLKSSGEFPSDTFDFRQMQEQLEFPDKLVPRWFGHGLSLPPDSGVGLGSTKRTGEKGAARHKQSTLQPTISHPAQRKRRAGSRMTTDFDLGADLMSEGTQRGTPRKRAMFGLGC